MVGSSWRTLRMWSCLALGCGAIPVGAVAPNDPQRSAEQRVKEALHAEIYGLSHDREQHLDEAQRLAPQYAPAHWHAGEVRYQNQWVAPEVVAARVAHDAALNEYRKVRDSYAATVDGQLSLANWCQKKKLLEQERAHLTRVIDINPDHGEARQRLSYQRVEGTWMTEAEVKAGRDRGQAAAKALATWQPKLEELRKHLAPSAIEAQRKVALARLQEIKDPAAVPVMELVFSDADRETALLIVDAFDKIPDEQAALALARQALFSPHVVVRMSAAKKLRSKSADLYVPALLSAMYTPVQARTEIYQGTGGRLMFRQSFLREGQNGKELSVLETAYRRDAIPGGDGRETLGRAVANAALTEAQRLQLASAQNIGQDSLNDRICGLLTLTQEGDVSPRPESWWQWWNETNEVYVAPDKPTKQTVQTQQVTIQDRLPVALTSTGTGMSFGNFGGRAVMDCFLAGTPVWTMHGLLPIEKIKVGDMVLSQDVDSGEVKFKPVLRTTVRPASKLVRATIGGETFQMSGGHLVWAAGTGWTKARQLKSGAALHTLTGVTVASTVEYGVTAETYNLIVADYNTYFVGQAKLLSHDNTIKRNTKATVPGLVESH